MRSDRIRFGDLIVDYSALADRDAAPDSRTKRTAALDALLISVTFASEANGTFGSRAGKGETGTIQLADLSQSSAPTPTPGRTIEITVPRATAVRQGISVTGLHGSVFTSSAAALLASHLLGIRQTAAALPPEAGSRLARTILDLLSLAVAPTGRTSTTNIDVDIAAVARTAIDRDLGGALNVSRLCQMLGVSRSTLHRQFEADGGVQAYIRRQRLEAVRRALIEGDPREPIHVIAERFGFSDSAHLSRLFRSQYGTTPSNYRRQSRG